jgi:hypothetical protein
MAERTEAHSPLTYEWQGAMIKEDVLNNFFVESEEE